MLWAERFHEMTREPSHGFMIDPNWPPALTGHRDLRDNVRLGGFIFNVLLLTEISVTDSLGGSAAEVSSFLVGTICRGAQVLLSSVLSVAGNNEGRNRNVQQIGNLASSIVSPAEFWGVWSWITLQTWWWQIGSTCLKGGKGSLCKRQQGSWKELQTLLEGRKG